jgi:hypothetical protein
MRVTGCGVWDKDAGGIAHRAERKGAETKGKNCQLRVTGMHYSCKLIAQS